MYKKIAALAILALALTVGLTGKAMALGTPVGTTITNQARVDYEDTNNNTYFELSNTVTTTVTQVYGVDVTPPTASASGINGTSVVYTLTVTNTGNGNDNFDLASALQSGWTPTSVTFFLDAGLVTPVTATGVLAADASTTVYVRVNIPNEATAADNTTSVVRATATSQGAAPATVSDFSDLTTTALAAVISMLKSASTLSPVPGGAVTYTITLTNNGHAAATSVVFTDVVQEVGTDITYQTESITLNGVGKGDSAVDGDEASYDDPSNTITVNVGTIGIGASATITFKVDVAVGTANGVTSDNTATSTYNSGANPKNATSNTVTITVATPVLTIAKTVNGGATANAAPGDTLSYSIVVTNEGDGPAQSVVVTDLISTFTTYTPGTLQLGGVDYAGPGGYTAGPPPSISVTVGILNPGESATITFDVVVN